MNTNPFDEHARLSVIQGKVVSALDGWQITDDMPSVNLWKAVSHTADTAIEAMLYQESMKRPYLIALCREAREEIPVWNILARRDFDKNMIQWLGNKEAELEAAAEEKACHANQR